MWEICLWEHKGIIIGKVYKNVWFPREFGAAYLLYHLNILHHLLQCCWVVLPDWVKNSKSGFFFPEWIPASTTDDIQLTAKDYV